MLLCPELSVTGYFQIAPVVSLLVQFGVQIDQNLKIFRLQCKLAQRRETRAVKYLVFLH